MNIFERTVALPLGRAHRSSLSSATRQTFPLGVAPRKRARSLHPQPRSAKPTNQARCHPARQAMQLLLRQTATSVGELKCTGSGTRRGTAGG